MATNMEVKKAKLFKGAEYLITEATKDDVFTPEDFTDEQKQIGETTAQFVLNEVVPHRAEIENHDFDLVVQLMKKCGELGLLMIDAPEEYGGLELDKATSMLAGGENLGSRFFFRHLLGPFRHRHAAARLLRHAGAEGEIPAERSSAVSGSRPTA